MSTRSKIFVNIIVIKIDEETKYDYFKDCILWLICWLSGISQLHCGVAQKGLFLPGLGILLISKHFSLEHRSGLHIWVLTVR